MPFHLYINDCHNESQVCVQTQSSLVQLKGLSYKESNSKMVCSATSQSIAKSWIRAVTEGGFLLSTMCINKIEMMDERLHTDKS